MNRKIAPEIYSDIDFKLISPKIYNFDNGCKLINFNYDSLPVSQINFIFPAGKKYQNRPLLASYTGKMLFEGTETKNHKQISNAFDKLGAKYVSDVQDDFVSVSTLVVNNKIDEIINIFYDIFKNVNFPEKQLRINTKNDKQNFIVNLEKVSYVANREFVKVIYNNHPYSMIADINDFDTLNSKDLKTFYDSYYDFTKCIILWTGKIEKDILKKIKKLFGNIKFKNSYIEEHKYSIKEIKNKEIVVSKNNVSQSAIVIGKLFPNYKHEDFYDNEILNVILGGYFGSRLMKNIREEKGYTYGIGSRVITNIDCAVFKIASQVKAEHTKDTINEIKNEIYRLQSELLKNEELEQVVNYLRGQLMQDIDGPLAQSRFYLKSLLHGLDAQKTLDNYINSMKYINPEKIKNLANKYLQPDSFYYVISGANK